MPSFVMNPLAKLDPDTCSSFLNTSVTVIAKAVFTERPFPLHIRYTRLQNVLNFSV